MASLFKLPEEVLVPILTGLHQSDLAALSQTCSKAHERVTPSLYASMDFELLEAAHLRDRAHSMALAVRTILQHPSLGGLVQDISVATTVSDGVEFPFPEDVEPAWISAFGIGQGLQLEASQDIISSCRQLLQGESFSEGHDLQPWLIALSRGRLDGILACLILRCANLKVLRLGARVMVSKLLDSLLKLIFDQHKHSCLQNLWLSADLESCVDVHVLNTSQSYCTQFECLTPILQLPAVSSLTAVVAELDLKARGFDMSSTLQSLELRNTELSEDALGCILKATPQLKKLTYLSTCDLASSRSRRTSIDQTLNCELLERSLSFVQGTLEELNLSFHYFSFNPDFFGIGFHGFTGSLTSLSRFGKLRVLTAPYVILLGWSAAGKHPKQLCDTLPVELQRLILTDDLLYMEEFEWTHSDLLEQVQHVAQQMQMQGDLEPKDALAIHLRNSYWDDVSEVGLKELFEISDAPCRVFDTEVPSDVHQVPFVVRDGGTTEIDRQRMRKARNKILS